MHNLSAGVPGTEHRVCQLASLLTHYLPDVGMDKSGTILEPGVQFHKNGNGGVIFVTLLFRFPPSCRIADRPFRLYASIHFTFLDRRPPDVVLTRPVIGNRVGLP